MGARSAPGRAVCGKERITRVVVGQDGMYFAIHAEGEVQVGEESAACASETCRRIGSTVRADSRQQHPIIASHLCRGLLALGYFRGVKPTDLHPGNTPGLNNFTF